MAAQSDADRHKDKSAYHWFSTKQVLEIIFVSFIVGAAFGWVTLAIGVYTSTYQNFVMATGNFLWTHWWVTPSTALILSGIGYIKYLSIKKKKLLEVKTKQ